MYVSYIYIYLFMLHGYLANSQYDQLPVGLITQLVEHRTGITEVMGSNHAQAYFFYQAFFGNCFSCVVTARIFLLFYLSSTVQNICFIYLHLFIRASRVYYELTIDQLPVGLIAHWVELCTGIAEVMGSNPVEA